MARFTGRHIGLSEVSVGPPSGVVLRGVRGVDANVAELASDVASGGAQVGHADHHGDCRGVLSGLPESTCVDASQGLGCVRYRLGLQLVALVMLPATCVKGILCTGLFRKVGDWVCVKHVCKTHNIQHWMLWCGLKVVEVPSGFVRGDL